MFGEKKHRKSLVKYLNKYENYLVKYLKDKKENH